MTNLESILKSIDITLPTKVHIVKAVAFPVVMYGCDSWTIKKVVKVKVRSLSRVYLFVTPWTVAYEAPLSMGFSRQAYWNGLPFPSPGDLPNPGIEPGSPALQADAFTIWATWEAHKKGYMPNNWCSQTMVLDKTTESPLDSKEIKPVTPKGNHPWAFIGRTDDKAEAPMVWPHDAKSWITGKDPDAGKDGRQKENGAAEHEKLREHQQLHGQESEQALGHSGGQRGLTCCSPWGCTESDNNLQLNDNNYDTSSPLF